jgi:hypothetical protein
MTHKIVHETCPSYLTDFVTLASDTSVLAWMQQKIHLLLKLADSGTTCQKNCVQIQIV